ncbi:MerR family transcriptional regulator [Ruminococcus sp. OA3]|uniref:MerR family transcriptional regulator n=1 Tax=Ruminococcus sp. OA3 TaxID=2914164 RepID=UPI001F058E70|nr:MerR family transcriptional regulator [Ruminococcus sp. OA3]MCH1982545.1 MerR family transcriptional regulator [Ruminococcus sp. OA3]
MKSNRFLTAGEFAKITGTTKHTLFHYDKIGLLPPDHRTDNGYRYYSPEQLETFDVICTLRELDMPLAEIRQYLQHKSPELFMKLLEQEEELISRKMKQLKQTRALLRKKSVQLASYLERRPEDPELLEFPEQYYISSYSKLTDSTMMASAIGSLYEHCASMDDKSPYSVGYLQYQSVLSQGTYTDYHTIYLLFDNPPKRLRHTVKPAGTYLCVWHTGYWDLIGNSYQKLFAFADARGLKLEGHFFEDAILDGLTVSEEELYVTRISVRVV